MTPEQAVALLGGDFVGTLPHAHMWHVLMDVETKAFELLYCSNCNFYLRVPIVEGTEIPPCTEKKDD